MWTNHDRIWSTKIDIFEDNGIHFTSSSKLDRYIDLGELDG